MRLTAAKALEEMDLLAGCSVGDVPTIEAMLSEERPWKLLGMDWASISAAAKSRMHLRKIHDAYEPSMRQPYREVVTQNAQLAAFAEGALVGARLARENGATPADVFEVLRFAGRLVALEGGETGEVDHAWGFVRRVADGWRVAAPGQAGAEGNWRGTTALGIVDELWENECIRRSEA